MAGECVDNSLQTSTLLAEFLSTLGIIPYIRRLKLTGDFDQSFCLGVIVKDTP
jgi:hypothetical protein